MQVVPEKVLIRVGTDAIQGASILVHLPALAVRVKAVATRLQLVLDELLCHLRDCTPNIYIFFIYMMPAYCLCVEIQLISNKDEIFI